MKIKFKEYRKKRDLSQEEVAKILGVDRAAVAKWETGANSPRLDRLVELAKLFRCSVDDLLGFKSK